MLNVRIVLNENEKGSIGFMRSTGWLLSNKSWVISVLEQQRLIHVSLATYVVPRHLFCQEKQNSYIHHRRNMSLSSYLGYTYYLKNK